MSLEEELRPEFARCAAEMAKLLADREALEEVRRLPSQCKAFTAVDMGAHYLQVQVGALADLMDGRSSAKADVGVKLPSAAQKKMMDEFERDGPREAEEELLHALSAYVRAGATRESLVALVDLAIVSHVMES